MVANKQGRDVILAFEDSVAQALQNMLDEDGDSNAMILARAAKLIRKEMPDKECSFEGAFECRSEEDSILKTLLALMQMILYGPNIKGWSWYGFTV